MKMLCSTQGSTGITAQLCLATASLLLSVTIIAHVSAVVQIPSSTSVSSSTAEPSYDDVDALFEHFQVKFRREYVDAQERASRFEAFKVNVRRIQELRRSNPYAHFGLTHMTDAHPHESYKRGLHGGRSLKRSEFFTPYVPKIDLERLPYSADWRTRGAVNPVRDQMQCGSCWAFAIAAVTESMWFLKTGTLPRISEQMLVSCDPGAYGCHGANSLDVAVRAVVQREDGIMGSRDAYPYASGLSYVPPCDTSFVQRIATVKGAVDVVAKDEVAMAAYIVEHGPLVVAIDASGLDANYHHGILTSIPSNQIDHAVAIVGYGNSTVTDKHGESAEVPYWIVRNSWGESWGEDGYVRILRGADMALIAEVPMGILV